MQVIGDGAITGGMAYEAMNHAGFLDTNMIVILNDNQQVAQSVKHSDMKRSSQVARLHPPIPQRLLTYPAHCSTWLHVIASNYNSMAVLHCHALPATHCRCLCQPSTTARTRSQWARCHPRWRACRCWGRGPAPTLSAGTDLHSLDCGFARNNLLVLTSDAYRIAPRPHCGAIQANRQLRELREIAKGVTKQLPGVIQNATAKIDEYARGMISGTGSTLFEELGFYYIGPVDGHNLQDLVDVLTGECEVHLPFLQRRAGCGRRAGDFAGAHVRHVLSDPLV